MYKYCAIVLLCTAMYVHKYVRITVLIVRVSYSIDKIGHCKYHGNAQFGLIFACSRRLVNWLACLYCMSQLFIVVLLSHYSHVWMLWGNA